MSHFRISDLDCLKIKVGLRIFFLYNIILLSLESSRPTQGFWQGLPNLNTVVDKEFTKYILVLGWGCIQEWYSIQLNKTYTGGIHKLHEQPRWVVQKRHPPLLG